MMVSENNTNRPAEASLVELFQRQAECRPEAPALVGEDGSLSYRQLAERSSRLADRLVELGAAPEAPIVVLLERSLDLTVTMMAVLLSGAVYVPLDPEYPDERLRFILDDLAGGYGQPPLLISQPSLAPRLAGLKARILYCAESAGERLDGMPPSPAAWSSTSRSGNAAYIIYTSGSTGRPKGVLVEHGALAAHCQAMVKHYEIRPADRILQFASSSFDVSLEQTFAALLSGACLVVRGAYLWEPARFREMASRFGLTVADLSPAYLHQLALDWRDYPQPAPDLRLVIVGGEALRPETLALWRQLALHSVRLVNAYGPTEAVITATAAELGRPGAELSIGRPLPGRQTYLLDDRLRPVPAGQIGELYLGGDCLARGYLNRPALTAERFLPDPFSGRPGARLYRTGDLARLLADGSIAFVGRDDGQVKIRGFRIELGEVEARLHSHPGLLEAAVIAREAADGATFLAAYYVGAADVSPGKLRAYLAEALPDYMIPAAYVRLPALPRGVNQKLDRAALPPPDQGDYARRAYQAPLGEMEEVVAAIWSEVLKAERVGRDDDFFALGGHSLLTVQVLSRLRQRLGLEVAIGQVFEQPVLADFAASLVKAERAFPEPKAIVPRPPRLPLSLAQQRLWFLAQMKGGSQAYHIPEILKLRGRLDKAALRRALDRIVQRHEALRTSFGLLDDEPVQLIAPAAGASCSLLEQSAIDPAALAAIIAEEAAAAFDLERGPPLRGRLVAESDDLHTLLVTMHHIVSDGWSVAVFVDELSALYSAFCRNGDDPLPPLDLQYADYALWQRAWLSGPRLERQAEYWKGNLTGAPELLSLPTDRPRAAEQGFAGRMIGFQLDAGLTAALKGLSQRHGATLFMTLLAGWAGLLSRLCGQNDIVIGTPSANRGCTGIEGLIGFFVNTLALRLRLSDEMTVAQLIACAKAQAIGGQENQDIPFERVVELVNPARSLAHNPLFQVMFVWQNTPPIVPELPELTLEYQPAAPHSTAKADLALTLEESGQTLRGELAYSSALFDEATIQRLISQLRTLLTGLAADETACLATLPLLNEAERKQVLRDWNSTDKNLRCELPIIRRFEEQAVRTPGRVALAQGPRHLDYRELNGRANQLARYLQSLGLESEGRLAICLERSPEVVVAMLAAWKLGAAYVSLDPAYPAERLSAILLDSAASVFLARGSTLGLLAGQATAPQAVDAAQLAELGAGFSDANLPAQLAAARADSLAYIIYTSGSTGAPKGVAALQRSLPNLLEWYIEETGLGPADVVLVSTPLSFDLSQRNVFAPLLVGASLRLSEGAFNPNGLADLISDQAVSFMNLTPSAGFAILDSGGRERLSSLRCVVFGGEALAAGRWQEWPEPRPQFINGYGPSECSGISAWHRLSADLASYQGATVPIGRPIPNTRLYLLDRRRQAVPIGVVGELYIGGAPVAAGYWNSPRLTAEKFLADPFCGLPGERMFKTGDLGRFRADGQLEFLGREDFQVKLRGFRIELAEIEAALLACPEVREAVALARQDGAAEPRLVAYYVADQALAVAELRSQLAERLPEYMVPAAFVFLTALPLNANGKLDRSALPVPQAGAFAQRRFEAPQGEIELGLAAMWSELLGVDPVGRHDNFFELGGHSLLSVKLCLRANQRFDIDLALTSVFKFPTLAALADEILNLKLAAFDPADLAALADGVFEEGTDNN
ncbi:MAG: hypothetical protein A2004_13200 [Spirochaetes bacterium GWC1_61_12]|nr:MAG: hypothetical protein A2004_13200 [Spirochaetes bacterium GWC1_61_12]